MVGLWWSGEDDLEHTQTITMIDYDLYLYPIAIFFNGFFRHSDTHSGVSTGDPEAPPWTTSANCPRAGGEY